MATLHIPFGQCIEVFMQTTAPVSASDLLAVWEHLAERERSVLLTLGRRILMGQQQYGPLTKGKKDWLHEAKEEAMDMAVYFAISLED